MVKLKLRMKDYKALHSKAFDSRADTVKVDRKALVQLFEDHQELLRNTDHSNPEGRD